MRLRISFLALAIAGLLLTGAQCTGFSPYSALFGGANTHPAKDYNSPYALVYKGGMVAHLHTVPGQLGNAAVTKTGKACSASYLALVALGDSSIEAAKQNAGITKVASIDHQILAIAGILYHRHCTIITGE